VSTKYQPAYIQLGHLNIQESANVPKTWAPYAYSAVTTFRLVCQRFGKMYIVLIAILKFNVSANK